MDRLNQTCMKAQKHILLLIFLCASIVYTSSAQTAFWKSYDDLKNKKPLIADGTSFTYWDNGKVKLKVGGEKLAYSSDEYWGFTFRHILVRAINCGRHHLASVDAVGNYVQYSIDISTIGASPSNSYAVTEHFVSKDLGSTCYRFWDKKSLQKLTEDQPELKGLGKLLKDTHISDGPEALTDIITKSKEYKKIEEIAPEVKNNDGQK